MILSRPLKKLGNSCWKRSGASRQDLCRTVLGGSHGGGRPYPPAMAAGLTEEVWSLREVVR
jgi:hypothetical protein